MNQNELIKEKLYVLAEPDYQVFSSRLLPGVSNVLGVRLPVLRKLAKELANGQWQSYLNYASDDSFEEIMLQGMTIGYVKSDLTQLFYYIDHFIPKINNWSVCDSFCSGLKLPKTYPHEMWNYIIPYLSSTKEYFVRFGVVMLIFYYINEEHLEQVFILLDAIKHPSYYVRMSVAWTISICYISFPERTMNYLNNNSLEDETYHKTLQKIMESLKTNKETKEMIRGMKRK